MRQVQLGALDLLQQQPVHLLAQLPHLQARGCFESCSGVVMPEEKPTFMLRVACSTSERYIFLPTVWSKTG